MPLIGIEPNDYSSSGFLEDCVLLLKATLKKLQDVGDGATRQIGFWMRNVEKPKLVFDGRERGGTRSEEHDET